MQAMRKGEGEAERGPRCLGTPPLPRVQTATCARFLHPVRTFPLVRRCMAIAPPNKETSVLKCAIVLRSPAKIAPTALRVLDTRNS
ncbi:unnamed protein product [Ectocarpus sp. 4 AP-2014]